MELRRKKRRRRRRKRRRRKKRRRKRKRRKRKRRKRRGRRRRRRKEEEEEEEEGNKTILHSRSVDPRKLRIGVKYYIVHMYSMPYYPYGSTANFLFLGPTEFIYIKRMVL